MNLKDMREAVKARQARIKDLREEMRVEKYEMKCLRETLASERKIAMQVKADQKALVAQKRAAKKAERIAKMEAKIAAMKNPVGVAAKKAAQKPSLVRSYDRKAAEQLLTM